MSSPRRIRHRASARNQNPAALLDRGGIVARLRLRLMDGGRRHALARINSL